MTNILYSLRTDGDQYRITKIVDGEPEGSYLTTERECECSAGYRHTCRHRQMLPQMLAHHLCNTHWFFDFDGGGRIVDFHGTPKHLIEQLERSRTQEETVRGEETSSLNELAAVPGITVMGLEDMGAVHNAIADAVGEPRQTFTIPDGYEAVRDVEGRATGEVRPVPAGQHVEEDTIQLIPPGDYTAEVGRIKTFDDGTVLMQMKNIKPWRRL